MFSTFPLTVCIPTVFVFLQKILRVLSFSIELFQVSGTQ